MRYHPDKADFRETLRASVDLVKVEGGKVNHDWGKSRVEEILARYGLKDFEL